MFTGVLTKILLGLLAGSLLWGGATYLKYNWWDKPAYEKKITDLQNANSELQVTKEKQQTEIDQLKAKQVIKRRVGDAQTKVDRNLGNSDAVVDFFRLRRKGSISAPAHGGKGGP
jgi:hypothetical protein